jgi:CheY-like chemotaxis protein
MNHKVLLADDSLTIQKVIKITLANQPYDIVDCSSEDELFQKLTATDPKIVFLDFNLSEKYTGYELTTKIKSALPATKVLLLLGTFDTIDDAAMEKCGASDKIVKPFDSNKFISICAHLVDTFAEEPEEAEEEYVEEEEEDQVTDTSETYRPAPPDKTGEFSAEDFDNQWQVGPSVSQMEVKEEEKPLDDSFPGLNPLDLEVSDWGMSVPGVIGEHAGRDPFLQVPPVIQMSEKKALPVQPEVAAKEESKFPQSDDLDYPTIEELKAAPAQAPAAVQPKYVSEENLITLNQDTEDFGLELESHYTQEDNVAAIEDQIKDEIEENLWQVDEFEDLKREVSSKIEEMQNSFESNFDQIESNVSEDSYFDSTPLQAAATTASAGPSSEEIEAMVKRHVQSYMDDNFKKIVEKIAWEVIPDLAENLIRQELSKISQKIINDEA